MLWSERWAPSSGERAEASDKGVKNDCMKPPPTFLLGAGHASPSSPPHKCCHGPVSSSSPVFKQHKASSQPALLPTPQCLLHTSCWLETRPFPLHPRTLLAVCSHKKRNQATSSLALCTKNKSTCCSGVTEAVSTCHGAVDGTWCSQG